jgi:hypothetical protein
MANQKSPESLPSPTFTVPSSGKELRMSYGMFNDIMRLVGDVQDVSTMLITDATTRDLVIRRLFTENNKAVEKTEELVDSYSIDILPSEMDGILAWVADHSAHFLLSTGRAMTTVVKKYQDQMPKDEPPKDQSSSPSKTGLED